MTLLTHEEVVYDLETDGLLEDVTIIHCMVIICINTGKLDYYNDHDDQGKTGGILEGLERLHVAKWTCGHNIDGYDYEVIKKLHPKLVPLGESFDTLIVSKLIYSDMKATDFAFMKKHYKDLPGFLIGSHGLKAWGYRLGDNKGDYDGGWEFWSPEMQTYCNQDGRVTEKLFRKFHKKNYSMEAIELEHGVSHIIRRQITYGFPFNVPEAHKLKTELEIIRDGLKVKLREEFGSWYARKGKLERDSFWCHDGVKRKVPFTLLPKQDNKTHGYVKGRPLTAIKLVEFNAASRDHIGSRLVAKYKWKPTEFGKDGKPTVDEDIMKHLKYPCMPDIMQYLMIDKRLGMISEGKQAWLKKEVNGRIHGNVNVNGAVTGRMTHNAPNVAQTPANDAEYGERCRALFTVGAGKKLVGADASGLELRVLAHFMARWDGGKYAKTVCEGKQEEGTDIHTVNQKAAGLPTRPMAKTFIYGFLYGAGDAKIGSIVDGTSKEGKQLKEKFLAGLPALSSLVSLVKSKVIPRQISYIRGLDGRMVPIRHQHAALNTLLQSGGAIIMKKALVILDDSLQEKGLVPGMDYEFVANIHDEFQLEVSEEHAELVGHAAVMAIEEAGKHFNFKCPLTGSYATGYTWKETH